MSDFSVRGRLSAENIIARGNGLHRAMVEYAVTNGGTPHMRYVVGGSMDSLSASGFALDSATIQATYAEPSGTIELAVYQDSGYVYRAGADFLLSLDSNQVMWRSLSLQLDSALWVAAVPGLVQWGKHGIRVHDLDLRNRTNGRIYANGDLPTEGPIKMVVDLSGLQVANLVGLAESDLAATGLIDFKASIAGTRRAPAIRGAFSVMGASYRDAPLPDLRDGFQYADEKLVSHADLIRDGGTVARATRRGCPDQSGARGSDGLARARCPAQGRLRRGLAAARCASSLHRPRVQRAWTRRGCGRGTRHRNEAAAARTARPRLRDVQARAHRRDHERHWRARCT